MRLLLVLAALISSTLAFIAAASIGLFLAGVNESGVRGAGLLLVVAAFAAFAAALWVVFAPARFFRGWTRAAGLLALLTALVPLLAISAAAISFSGNPLATASPALDWSAAGAAVFLAVGAVSLIALTLSKLKGGRASPRVEATRPAQSALSGEMATGVEDDEDEVRVIVAGDELPLPEDGQGAVDAERAKVKGRRLAT